MELKKKIKCVLIADKLKFSSKTNQLDYFYFVCYFISFFDKSFMCWHIEFGKNGYCTVILKINGQ